MRIDILALAGFALIADPLFAETDLSGEMVFKNCRSCHLLSAPDNQHHAKRQGPNLFALENRPIGGVEGFAYSRAMQAEGEAGKIWDTATLHAFLASPSKAIKGTTMRFNGIADENERAALIQYLFAFDGTGTQSNQDPELDPAILAIEGDPDYGEYLSSACATCHQLDGDDNGIPSIIAWPEEQFVTVMHAYRNKDRDNPVMQQYAAPLSDEEIAALAAYYGKLGQ